MSTPATVAQRALEEAQTAALIEEDGYALRVLLTALNYIASGGKMYSGQWDGLPRKERRDPA